MSNTDETTRTVTIVLSGQEIEDMETMCRRYLGRGVTCRARNTAENILEAITGD
jgi:hypothetical protein